MSCMTCATPRCRSTTTTSQMGKCDHRSVRRPSSGGVSSTTRRARAVALAAALTLAAAQLAPATTRSIVPLQDDETTTRYQEWVANKLASLQADADATHDADADDDAPSRTRVHVLDDAEPRVAAFRQRKFAERREQLDAMTGASAIESMRQNLAVAGDITLELESRAAALTELQELVEDLDNARDFESIRGFRSLLPLLEEEAPAALLAPTAWVLGTAAQNNGDLQRHMLEIGALPLLVRLARSATEKETVRAKAIYAISGMIRANPTGRRAFEAEGGLGVLIDLLGAPDSPLRLLKKAIVLFSDLLGEEDMLGDGVTLSSASDGGLQLAVRERAAELCAGVERLLESDEVDAREKGVFALGRLASGAGALREGALRCASSRGVRRSLERMGKGCAGVDRSVGHAADEDAEGCGEAESLARALTVEDSG